VREPNLLSNVASFHLYFLLQKKSEKLLIEQGVLKPQQGLLSFRTFTWLAFFSPPPNPLALSPKLNQGSVLLNNYFNLITQLIFVNTKPKLETSFFLKISSSSDKVMVIIVMFFSILLPEQN